MNRVMSCGVLALAILFQACSPQEMTFSYTGSQEGYAQAFGAAQRWNGVCGTDILVTAYPGGIPLNEVDYVGEGLFGVTTRGWDGRVERVAFQRSSTGAIVVLHEFGHALGLDHAESGIMKNPQVTNEDVTQAECDLLP